jgi:putative oxidoreductase
VDVNGPRERVPPALAPQLKSLARMIFGFLLFRHGMEQVLGFPGAWEPSAPLSFYGIIKLLAFPGGILMMLGLFTRPVALLFSVLFAVFWFAGPLQGMPHSLRLFGARGPSDPVLLNAFFFLYLYATGAGPWSLDRWRDVELAEREPAGPPPRVLCAVGCKPWSPYALGALRIVAGFLFIHHGIEKYFGGRVPLDLLSLRALAGTLENVGGPMMMLGLFARPLFFLLSGEMAFAYFINHAQDGFWASFIEPNQEAAILNCYLFLFMSAAGPGAWSLDALRARAASPAKAGHYESVAESG